MSKKGWSVKRFFLTLVFVALVVVVFILLGGGNLLRSAGRWVAGVGKGAEVVKHRMEEKASKTSEAVGKVIDTVKSVDKKGEKK